MTDQTNPAHDKQFAQIIHKIFVDDKFAHALEQDPEKALKDAGIHIDAHQSKALKANAHVAKGLTDQAGTAAFVRPVVSVLTKGTRPAVSVVVSSAVVAQQVQAKEDKT